MSNSTDFILDWWRICKMEERDAFLFQWGTAYCIEFASWNNGRLSTSNFNHIRCHKRKANATLLEYSTNPTIPKSSDDFLHSRASLSWILLVIIVVISGFVGNWARTIDPTGFLLSLPHAGAPLFDQLCPSQRPNAWANYLGYSVRPRLFRSMAGSRVVSIVIASILQSLGE